VGRERIRDVNLNSDDSYETLGQWERCITRAPTELLPSFHNKGFQAIPR
jgi:hypothetical protein